MAITAQQIPITGLGAGLVVQPTDIYPAVDVTDHTQAPTGTTKRYTISQLQNYLNLVVSSVRMSVNEATTVNLSALYNNGNGGVGATLTNNGAFAALVIDTVTVNVGDRVLVKNQTLNFQNGIYVVTNAGSVSTNWILTRSSDYDNSTPGSVVQGSFVAVSEGAINIATIWVETAVNPIVIGVSPILFQTANDVFASPLPLADGGTSASLAANDGGIVYSNASSMQILPGTAIAGQILQSGSLTTPSWSIPTYPAISGIANTYLTSDGTNIIYSLFELILGGNISTEAALTLLGAFSATFNFTAPTNVTFPTSGTLATTAQVSAFTWSTVSAPTILAPSNGYFASSGSQVIFSLPTLASVGDTYRVYASTPTGWQIIQNGSQIVEMGNVTTTAGVTGSLNSTAMGDCIEIVCNIANNNFVIVSSIGNITLV